MKISRIYDKIENLLEPNKVLVIYGPRQVGKTTLVKDFLARTSMKWRYENGDDTRIQELGSLNFDIIKEFAKGYDIIAFDEKIPRNFRHRTVATFESIPDFSDLKQRQIIGAD